MSDILCIRDTFGLCSPGKRQEQTRTVLSLFIHQHLSLKEDKDQTTLNSRMTPTAIYKTAIFIFGLEFHIVGRKWKYCSFGEIGACNVSAHIRCSADGAILPSLSLSLSGRARGPVSDQSPLRRRRFTGGCLSWGNTYTHTAGQK